MIDRLKNFLKNYKRIESGAIQLICVEAMNNRINGDTLSYNEL